jgi:hypothetical protein
MQMHFQRGVYVPLVVGGYGLLQEKLKLNRRLRVSMEVHHDRLHRNGPVKSSEAAALQWPMPFPGVINAIF